MKTGVMEQQTTPKAPAEAPRPAAVTTSSTGRRVTIRDLNAYYGDQHAVRGLDIEFEPNGVTAIIGPSGCGKSTMVRCINRMHEEVPGARATGEITLDDIDIYGTNVDVVSVRRTVGMVFQKPNPFPTMSVFDNVAAGMRLSGLKGGKMRDRVEQTLRGAGLWEEVKDRLDKPGIGLSGGQQQRLCIARTLAVEPEVILMDEPASALDPIATAKIEDLMQQLTPHYSIVIVTHNMQQAARVSDRTAFLTAEVADDGRERYGVLVEYDKTSKIFTRPADSRTEAYITGRFG